MASVALRGFSVSKILQLQLGDPAFIRRTAFNREVMT